MRQKKEKLLTICHASNSKLNKKILNICIHNQEIRENLLGT